VAVFTVTGAGSYELVLQNDYDCIDTSGVLEISSHNCDSCKCINFSKGVYAYTEPCPKIPPPCCVYKIVMCITNTCDRLITATVTATSGTLTPPVITIPWGTKCDTFTYTPPAGPFAGGWVYFSVSWSDEQGDYKCRDSVYVQPCNNGGGGGSKERPTITTTDGDASLALVPNPAQNTTRVYWTLSNATNTGSIEVYDVAGRLMRTYEAKAEDGYVDVSLDKFAGGVYMVVLKENGRVMKQLRLSVLR
jgi:hypothetical protein